ncbi:uncharacterized protein LOC118424661 [Branchiostoma floridae]|uniref:Uncharacterized protein LOC118424661 n=1 Tax=Branchiostoma floridae TaxID=7739 RepID=A0A9J7LTX5_BRAFL|nr:uncharacterized protein LOC118424661 [Branchiostoma floridae]
MAGSAREFEGITDDDLRHFDFVQTLLHISQSLTKEETTDVKLFCMHLIPKGKAEKLRRAVDVFRVLIELRKIDRENLDFVEEILERIGREDLIRDALRPFQPPDREIPENPELQPRISAENGNEEGITTSNTYWVVHGPAHMIQETLDRNRNSIASLIGTRKSQVKFRGYKKHKSILVHFSVPRENTAVLRHMADHSDPRLVYMGVKSLQIDAERPIKVTQGAMLNDIKRQRPVDDIEVGCSTKTKQQRAPQSWTSLSALNLFSDALPLHLQAAASLEYQGFSYSLVRALVQKDRLREHQMRQAIQNFRKAEAVDSATLMTMRSKLTIAENRLKEALETIEVLEKDLQRAREYAEKAAKQMTSRLSDYTGEKPPGGWPLEYRGEKSPVGLSTQDEKAEVATQTHLADDNGNAGRQAGVVKVVQVSTEEAADESAAVLGFDGSKDRSDTGTMEETRPIRAKGAALGAISGERWRNTFTFGEPGKEPGKFDNPYDVVVSPSNEIFVVEKGNKRVQVHDTEGVYLRHFPTLVPGAEDGEMTPHDISIDDSDSTVWVVGDDGKANHHVVQYSKDGIAMRKFSLPRIRYYRGIAVDSRSRHILVTEADRGHGDVQVFRPDGSLVRRFVHPEMQYPRYLLWTWTETPLCRTVRPTLSTSMTARGSSSSGLGAEDAAKVSCVSPAGSVRTVRATSS